MMVQICSLKMNQNESSVKLHSCKFTMILKQLLCFSHSDAAEPRAFSGKHMDGQAWSCASLSRILSLCLNFKGIGQHFWKNSSTLSFRRKVWRYHTHVCAHICLLALLPVFGLWHDSGVNLLIQLWALTRRWISVSTFYKCMEVQNCRY